MTSKDNGPTRGLDQMTALIAWWGAPSAQGTGSMETQLKRLQTFASDLQKDCGDAYSQQVNAMFAANERLGHSLQELMQCRQPQEIIAAESNIVATLLEGASGQARSWIELTEKVQKSCAAMARDAAAEVGKQARQAAVKPPAEMERHAARAVAKEPAHA